MNQLIVNLGTGVCSFEADSSLVVTLDQGSRQEPLKGIPGCMNGVAILNQVFQTVDRRTMIQRSMDETDKLYGNVMRRLAE